MSKSATKFPGWRTMSGAERRNVKMHAMFNHAAILKRDALYAKLHAATAGTRFGAMIDCAYGKNRDATPRFVGKATITSDGFLMWSFVDRHGEGHSGAFSGGYGDYVDNMHGLARHLDLKPRDEMADFYAAMKAAIGQDYR